MARIPNARLVRHVRELPAAFVAVQGVPRRHVYLGSQLGCAIEEVDVDVAVSIVVEQPYAGADRLDDVPPTRAAVGVLEGNAGVRSYVLKLDGTVRMCLGQQAKA